MFWGNADSEGFHFGLGKQFSFDLGAASLLDIQQWCIGIEEVLCRRRHVAGCIIAFVFL